MATDAERAATTVERNDPIPDILWQYRFPAGIIRSTWAACSAYGLQPIGEADAVPPADHPGVKMLDNGFPGANITIVAPREFRQVTGVIMPDPALTIKRLGVTAFKKDRIDIVMGFPVSKQDDIELQKDVLSGFIGSRDFVESAYEYEDIGMEIVLAQTITDLGSSFARDTYELYLAEFPRPTNTVTPSEEALDILDIYERMVMTGLHNTFFDSRNPHLDS